MSLRKSLQLTLRESGAKTYANVASRKSYPQAQRKVVDMGKSLASKGFLRSHKPYTPVTNVAEKVSEICANLKISTANEYRLENLEEKYAFLDACFKSFQYCIPNSRIHELQSIGDVLQFYNTPVNTTVPYDSLKATDLPENLHIQHEYVRFHPDSDVKFNGQTAFPKNSTLVTGLKYRGKYKGHEAKRSWP
ncbi:39S ribosomal protein L50, mitochondrial-like [Rhagoletis pomonella]|uniref:39S ribosomal protein L50, mitochondrial-like n=1 Tax=Rhagoletis pomonella TaxID=28610 RepID=UPI00178241E8|nr:39S ribosomal protein L50, mitochondrial-like [Rhagoletis pomonella]XP_036342065.1 39S ribosomal protein L50, mitochondrial-like [Rhagoletis pomonella]XP_036344603.1 39S ribosomal protein L50, mitochondrial-like [Rhagoletis pomonella]XP_036344640.1 39S ribosomal protein L50, mitochondrial-like [Rhagoletis pomonella]